MAPSKIKYVPDLTETWDGMKIRHRAERVALVAAMVAKHHHLKEVAYLMRVDYTNLCNFCRTNGIRHKTRREIRLLKGK